jgi:hypothetical protein
MRKLILIALVTVVFVASLGFSFTTTVNEAQAGDGCEVLCMEFCLCQLSLWSGKWHDGYCDLNLCGPPCNGEGVPCL